MKNVKSNGTLSVSGQSSPFSLNENIYYDANFGNLSSSGTNGTLYQTTVFNTLPGAAKVGESGPLGVITSYSDTAKTIKTSTGTLSWALTADSSATALLKITNVLVAVSGVGNQTSVETLRVTPSGGTTKASVETSGSEQNLKFVY